MSASNQTFDQYMASAEVRHEANQRVTLSGIKYHWKDLEIRWTTVLEKEALCLAGNQGRLRRFLEATANEQLQAKREASSQWGEFA